MVTLRSRWICTGLLQVVSIGESGTPKTEIGRCPTSARIGNSPCVITLSGAGPTAVYSDSGAYRTPAVWPTASTRCPRRVDLVDCEWLHFAADGYVRGCFKRCPSATEITRFQSCWYPKRTREQKPFSGLLLFLAPAISMTWPPDRLTT